MFAIRSKETKKWLYFVDEKQVKLSFNRAKIYDREEIAEDDLSKTGNPEKYDILQVKLTELEHDEMTFWKRGKNYVELDNGTRKYDLRCAKCGRYGLRDRKGLVRLTPYCPFCGRKVTTTHTIDISQEEKAND